jgi:hypothetical protein
LYARSPSAARRVRGCHVSCLKDPGLRPEALLSKSPLKDNSSRCAADPSRLAASLVAYIPTGMLAPRSLPSGRLGCALCTSYLFAAPKHRLGRPAWQALANPPSGPERRFPTVTTLHQSPRAGKSRETK